MLERNLHKILSRQNESISLINSLNAKFKNYIESSKLICVANLLTGCYMMAIMAFHELNYNG